jgi:hypothetical protein
MGIYLSPVTTTCSVFGRGSLSANLLELEARFSTEMACREYLKNRVSGRLMEAGVSYDKPRLHRMGYFRRLMSNQEEITGSTPPLLKLCREHIDRSIQMDRAVASIARTRSIIEREADAAENRSRSWSDQGSDLGAGS